MEEEEKPAESDPGDSANHGRSRSRKKGKAEYDWNARLEMCGDDGALMWTGDCRNITDNLRKYLRKKSNLRFQLSK